MRAALTWLLAMLVGIAGAVFAVFVAMFPLLLADSQRETSLDMDGYVMFGVAVVAMLLGFAGGAWLVLRRSGQKLPRRAAVLRHLVAFGAGVGGLVTGFFVMALLMMAMMSLLVYAATGRKEWGGAQAILNVAGFGGGGLGATIGFGLAYWFGLARGWRALAWCVGAGAAIMVAGYLVTRL